MECTIVHCDRTAVAKGYCSRHYTAYRKYGDPLVVKQKQHHGLTLRERLERYTKKSDGCWLWIGFTDPNGYGRLNIDGRPILAHRLAYQVSLGDIPSGMVVCHKCDNPPCVNPDHLFLGTQASNVKDMHSKGRAHKRGMKGSEHPAAKVNEEIVRAIRACSLSTVKAAALFGLSRPTIDDIRKRRSWTHIE